MQTSKLYIKLFVPKYKRKRVVFICTEVNNILKEAYDKFKDYTYDYDCVNINLEFKDHIRLNDLQSYTDEYQKIIKKHLIKSGIQLHNNKTLKVIETLDSIINLYNN